VWPFFVVLGYPRFGDVAHLLDGVEQMRIQHFFTIGPVEALNIGVLIVSPRMTKYFDAEPTSGSSEDGKLAVMWGADDVGSEVDGA
jgi:hypothetical protein